MEIEQIFIEIKILMLSSTYLHILWISKSVFKKSVKRCQYIKKLSCLIQILFHAHFKLDK